MTNKSYTEDEFKEILKNLFSEKKRVANLKEHLKEKSPKEKFQAKVEQLQALALEEELIRIKTAFVESEKQNQTLQMQIDKAKPALQKLSQDCKDLQDQLKGLEESHKGKEEQLKEKDLLLAKQEATFHEQIDQLQGTKNGVEQKVDRLQKRLSEEKEEREVLQENYQKLEKAFKHNQRLHREQMEENAFQIGQLQEKLMATERQLQQTDLAKIHEEYSEKFLATKKEHKELADKLNHWLDETRAERDLLINELNYVKQNAMHALETKKKSYEEKLEQSYHVTQGWIDKSAQLEEESHRIKAIVEEKSKYIEEQQELIHNLQKNIKIVTQKLEEYDEEVHKAQTHLAKKVKESALFQDVAEKQKMQIVEEQKKWAQEQHRRVQLEQSLDLQMDEENKLKSYLNQCREEATCALREWEERCGYLQQENEKLQAKLVEFEKYKEGYEKLLTTFNQL